MRIAGIDPAPTALDLFAGGGGTSTGLADAGFNLVAAVEQDKFAAAVHRLNHPNTRVYCADIRELDPGAVMDELGLRPGQLTLLAASPPCQGLSNANQTSTQEQRDEKNSLISEVVRFVEVFRPQAVAIENVRNLRQSEKGRQTCASLAGLGYHVAVYILDAQYYGVPQRRVRCFVLAGRAGYIRPPRRLPGPPLTVRDAIAHLTEPGTTDDPLHQATNHSASTLRLIRAIPKDGGRLSDVPPEQWPSLLGRTPRKSLLHGGFARCTGRLKWDRPANTVIVRNRADGSVCFHPTRDRVLTARERAIFQGFPLDYRWDAPGTSKTACNQIIGNAVPPPLARAVGAQILADLGLCAAAAPQLQEVLF